MDAAHAPRPQRRLKEHIYQSLRERLIACEFAPGTMLSENQLAREYQVSRTPMREALALLERDGLVRVLPKAGAMVTEIRVQDLDEIFQLREALECWAVRGLASKLPEDHRLHEFRELFAATRAHAPTAEVVKKAVEWDHAFHMHLLKLCGNRRMVAVYRQVQADDNRIRNLSTPYKDRLVQTLGEHVEIIDAILRGDPVAAEDRVRSHLANARRTAREVLGISIVGGGTE